jgi:hypothetical protein
LNITHEGGRLAQVYSAEGKLVMSIAYQDQLELQIPADWKGLYLLKSTDKNGLLFTRTFLVE